MIKLSEARKTAAYSFTQPAVRLLAKTPITPSTLTWIGFLLAVGAAVLIAQGYLLAAGVVVLIAGLFDMLDGALARHTKQTTHFGAILDSTLDRLSEGVLLLGILILYARQPSTVGILLAGAALLSSPLVSYIRARGEALGIECEIGFFTRPERVVILALGLLLSHFSYALIIALAIIAVFSFITAGQRLIHLWRHTKVR
jgi:CDP-diacylglycerol--glycerol-3-phosphate 3-phosphatidyltransferase